MDRAGDVVIARVVLDHRDGQLAEVDDRGAGRYHAGDHRPLDHSRGALAIAGGGHDRALGEKSREGRAQPGAALGRELDVDQADEAVGGEQPSLVVAGPDDALVHRRPRFDLLVGPDLHPRIDRAALTDDDVIADHRPVFEQAGVLDGDVAADDRLAQPGVLADVGVSPDDRVADLGVLIDDGGIANAGRPVDEDAGLELALVADVGRAIDPHVIADLDVLPDPYVAVPALAGNLDVDPSLERIPIRLVVGLNVADIAPIAGHQEAIERHRVGEHLGEDVAAPVHHRRGRHHVEHLWLDDIDPGVDLVGEDLTPGWLFEEAVDRAIRVGDDDPELEWVRHRGQHDGGGRTLLLVVLHHARQVDVGHGVAADDDERLVQELLRILDAAGGAQRRIFDHVGDVHPEVRTVPEVIADRLAKVLQGDDHVGDSVLFEQAKDVLHHRLADHRHQGFWHPARQRPQPRALAARHNHSFHDRLKRSPGTEAPLASAGGAGSFWTRSRRKAAESSGLTTLIHLPLPSSEPPPGPGLGLRAG